MNKQVTTYEKWPVKMKYVYFSRLAKIIKVDKAQWWWKYGKKEKFSYPPLWKYICTFRNYKYAEDIKVEFLNYLLAQYYDLQEFTIENNQTGACVKKYSLQHYLW